ELERSRCTATCPPRRCQAPDAWKSAESSAWRQQRRTGAICASSSLKSSESDTIELQHAPLVLDAVRPPAADPVRRDNAVHREERRQLATGAERPGGARRAGVAGERRQFAVGDDLAAFDPAQCLGTVG